MSEMTEYYTIYRHGAPWAVALFDSIETARIWLEREYGYELGDSPYGHEAVVPDWKHREAYKFDNIIVASNNYRGYEYKEGPYKHPLWRREGFWIHNSHIHREHFAHISVDDPTKIAFTESAGKGERNIQTRMKPGRYLKKYFSDVLTEKQIAWYAEWWATGTKPAIKIEGELRFARTPDEIVAVYESGPGSCMHGSDCVRVYGAGDLAIAYVVNPDDKVISRALTWPEKKVIGRVYPTPDRWSDDGFESHDEAKAVHTDLTNRLKEMGYSSIYEDRNQFNGARLLKISAEDEYGRNHYVMPYIDCDININDAGDHFVMQYGGDYSPTNTSGLIYAGREPYCNCYECEEAIYDEEDATHVYGYWSDYNRRPRDRYIWCASCRDNHAFYCDATNEYYDSSLTDSVEMANGDTWVVGYAEQNAFQCEYDEEWYSKETYEHVVLEDGSIWLRENFEKYGFICKHDGCNYDKSEESVGHPGYNVKYDDDPAVHPQPQELEQEAA